MKIKYRLQTKIRDMQVYDSVIGIINNLRTSCNFKLYKLTTF